MSDMVDPSSPPIADLLLCQRFLPEFGGSIRWMHEVYRRWPGPVAVVTHDYDGHPPGTPQFPFVPCPGPGAGQQRKERHVTDANLIMDRRDIFMRNWGLESLDRLRRYGRMTMAVRRWLRRLPAGQCLTVHAIHAVPEVASLIPLKALVGRRLRIFCYAHGEEVNACASSRQLTWLMRRSYAICDRIFANSRYTAGVLEPFVDEPGKIAVLHPGVDLSEFAAASEAGQAWRRSQGYAQRKIILTLGRMDRRKNHQAVIRAVASLKSRHPDMLYVLAGEGREKAGLQSLAQELEVADRLLWPGNVDGSLRLSLYGGCDLLAMPSIRDAADVEGFGMVFLEAAACGKPVIAGKVGGQADAVKDGQTGLIVDGTDQDQVTASLDRLLSDAVLRQQMGTAGRRWAEPFDWPLVVERLRNEISRSGSIRGQ